MRVIGIVGSRRRSTADDYFKVLDAFRLIYQEGDHIVSGGCPQGGDYFAEKIAKDHQVPIKIHYAKWKLRGRAAGFIRNTDIANESTILIACVAPDRTGGTEDTIEKFCQGLHQAPFIKEGRLILV